MNIDAVNIINMYKIYNYLNKQKGWSFAYERVAVGRKYPCTRPL